MKRISSIIFLCLVLFPVTLSAQPQSVEKSKVYFIHSNKFNGFSSAFNMYIDGFQKCVLNNKHYSIHEIDPGNHTFSVHYAIMNLKGTGDISFLTEPGKTYYVEAVYQRGMFSSKLFCSEITENTAKNILPNLKEDNCM